MSNAQQLLPGFSFRADADFAGFFATAGLKLAKHTLENFIADQVPDCVYLSGAAGSGKSHLLQAACNAADAAGRSAIYLPLQQVSVYPPSAVLEDVLQADIICIDDVDAISGKADWQEALFHLYNQRFAAEKPLYLAASLPARLLTLELADLQSRLAACLAFQLPLMNDDEKIAMLQALGRARGIQINDASALFIIQRSGRSSSEIIDVLEKLDQASLIAKRKITVPFIKELLGW